MKKLNVKSWIFSEDDNIKFGLGVITSMTSILLLMVHISILILTFSPKDVEGIPILYTLLIIGGEIFGSILLAILFARMPSLREIGEFQNKFSWYLMVVCWPSTYITAIVCDAIYIVFQILQYIVINTHSAIAKQYKKIWIE